MLGRIRDRLKSYEAGIITSPEGHCAGVTIPLFEKEGRVYILLTKRTETVRVHKGEISFPGGMREETDCDMMETALRECCEEVGIEPGDVEIIGRLDEVVTLTGFVITPYVGVIPYPYPFRPSPREVAYLVYLPLDYLMDATPEYEQVSRDGKTLTLPYIYYEGDRIWGATCRILLRFREIISDETV